jgi:rhodanese-related sulfurtransferase
MLDKTWSFVAAAALGIAVLFPGLLAAQILPPSVGQLIAATKKQVKTIDMATFKAAYDKQGLGLIVDVREPAEYADGFIPEAVNVPRGLLELRIWPYVGFPDKTDMNRQLTLYCGSGARCVLGAKSLQDLGFTNVTAADMRIDDWAKAGYPLVKK